MATADAVPGAGPAVPIGVAVGRAEPCAAPVDLLGLLRARASGQGWLRHGQGSAGWCDLHDAETISTPAGLHGVWFSAHLARPLAMAEPLPLSMAAAVLGALVGPAAGEPVTTVSAVLGAVDPVATRPGGAGPALASLLVAGRWFGAGEVSPTHSVTVRVFGVRGAAGSGDGAGAVEQLRGLRQPIVTFDTCTEVTVNAAEAVPLLPPGLIPPDVAPPRVTACTEIAVRSVQPSAELLGWLLALIAETLLWHAGPRRPSALVLTASATGSVAV